MFFPYIYDCILLPDQIKHLCHLCTGERGDAVSYIFIAFHESRQIWLSLKFPCWVKSKVFGCDHATFRSCLLNKFRRHWHFYCFVIVFWLDLTCWFCLLCCDFFFYKKNRQASIDVVCTFSKELFIWEIDWLYSLY